MSDIFPWMRDPMAAATVGQLERRITELESKLRKAEAWKTKVTWLILHYQHDFGPFPQELVKEALDELAQENGNE